MWYQFLVLVTLVSCGEVPNMNNLKGKWFTLAHGFRWSVWSFSSFFYVWNEAEHLRGRNICGGHLFHDETEREAIQGMQRERNTEQTTVRITLRTQSQVTTCK